MFPVPGPLFVAKRGLVVSPSQLNISDTTTSPANCWAGVRFDESGEEFRTSIGGNVFNVSRGNWLDSGAAGDVWVQWTRSGGTLGDWNYVDAGDTRLQLSTGRQWGIVETGLGTSTIIGEFKFWDAATDGNEIGSSGTRTFTATVDPP